MKTCLYKTRCVLKLGHQRRFCPLLKFLAANSPLTLPPLGQVHLWTRKRSELKIPLGKRKRQLLGQGKGGKAAFWFEAFWWPQQQHILGGHTAEGTQPSVGARCLQLGWPVQRAPWGTSYSRYCRGWQGKQEPRTEVSDAQHKGRGGDVQRGTAVLALQLPLQNQTWKNPTCRAPQKLESIWGAEHEADCSEHREFISTWSCWQLLPAESLISAHTR